MKTILIVDDCTFTRGLYTKYLDPDKYHLLEANSGMQAIILYMREQPDLVLMDLLMPFMDGMETVRSIMEVDENAKVIICSADIQEERKEIAKELGVLHFMGKPINGEHMREIVHEILMREAETV